MVELDGRPNAEIEKALACAQRGRHGIFETLYYS